MGTISVVNFVSIDGVVQSPVSADEDRDGGFTRGGWVTERSDDTVNRVMEDTTVGAAGMMLGRRSYEIMAGTWSADMSVPAVAAMDRMPKYVVTRSPHPLPWKNSHRVDGDLPSAVADIRDGHDGEVVVFGSTALVRGLAAHDLVDTYRLLLFPVVLGNGKRMFDDQGALAAFTLAESVTSPNGIVILTWRRGVT